MDPTDSAETLEAQRKKSREQMFAPPTPEEERAGEEAFAKLAEELTKAE